MIIHSTHSWEIPTSINHSEVVITIFRVPIIFHNLFVVFYIFYNITGRGAGFFKMKYFSKQVFLENAISDGCSTVASFNVSVSLFSFFHLCVVGEGVSLQLVDVIVRQIPEEKYQIHINYQPMIDFK